MVMLGLTDVPYGEIGVAGILIVLVLKMVFDFVGPIGKRKSAACTKADDMIADLVVTVHSMKGQIIRTRDQIQDLHEWHNKDDGEGVKIWYVRRSLEDAITKLSINIGLQTDILREMAIDSRQAHKEMGEQLKGLRT